MIERNPVRRGIALAPVLLALALSGCSDKDSNPASAGDDTMDADTFGQQAISTLDFVNGIVDGVDELASGDFTGVDDGLGIPAGSPLRAEEVVWRADLRAWVLDVEGTETDETGSATYDIWLWIQFRDQSGSPQQDPDETTAEMEMQIDYVFDVHAVDQGSTFDLGMDYVLSMTVDGMPDGPYGIDGDGDMNVTMAFSDGQNHMNIAMDMAWMMDLVAPANNGCPTGSALVAFDDWTFNAEYDGQGGYDWTVHERGTRVDEGRESLPCTVVPAS